MLDSDTEGTHTAPSLPFELLAEITRHVAETKFESKSLLYTLASTSRVFNELAEPELYRDIEIVCRDVWLLPGSTVIGLRAKRWCRTVIDNEERAALVRSVTVRGFGRCGVIVISLSVI